MDIQPTQDSIQVFIRVRPGKEDDSVLAFTQNQIKLDKHQFAFDKIFSPDCTQNDIFHSVGTKLLQNVIDGYNSCVFVYGQTGSGKTHTMIGQNNGLMQQSFRELFLRINRMINAQCFVTCSYFELYNEQIMDLLDPKKQKKLNIRQDTKKGVFVENLTEQTVLDCDKLMEVLYTGMKNRHIGETQMNHQSSRSHSVFTISLSCKMQQDGKKVMKTPKLHFVDLAGSQRQKMTQASGDRLKQAGNINKSLTTLGMVINALTSEKPKSHIPYRDSKLTSLLRDSLGGNSKTIIIATVSRSLLSFQQTLSTLNFANRAKMVKVKALINQESLSTNLQVYKQQIRKLKCQILRLKSEQTRSPLKLITHQVINNKQLSSQFNEHFEQINKKITALSEQLNQGVVSPSLENLLNNLTKNVKKPSVQMEQDDENIVNEQKYSSDFLEYLNSNYQLLTQINSKVNDYLEIKQELRNVANNRKIQLQSIKTPSKFERDQYEEIIAKRQNEIKQLEVKLLEIQSQLNKSIAERNEIERKMNFYFEQKGESESEIIKYKQMLLKAEQQAEIEEGQKEILKHHLQRVEKNVQQLQKRLKETKQLYIYAEEKYENQVFNSKKIALKIKTLEEELNSNKTQLKKSGQENLKLRNEIDDFRLIVEEKQNKQDELKNEICELEQTLEFNKKILNDTTQKVTHLNQLTIKNNEESQSLRLKNKFLTEENLFLKEKLESQEKIYTSIIERKQQQYRQLQVKIYQLQNQNKDQQKQRIRLDELYDMQLQKSNIFKTEIKMILQIKEQQLVELQYKLEKMQDQMKILERQKTNYLQNYQIKYEAKVVECNMLDEKYKTLKNESQVKFGAMKQSLDELGTKNNQLICQMQNFKQINEQLLTKLKEDQSKIMSISTIMEQNQQLKQTYKELVKENYKLKGKYKVAQNQQTEKQKNEQLLAKLQFYEQKFRLMSIQYQKTTQIVKKLKEREIQKNKKISFYEQTIRLSHIDNDIDEKNLMIKNLKQQNRQLKFKLDNIQSNLSTEEYEQKCKNMKEFRQNQKFTVKQAKLKTKLIALMSKWNKFNPKNDYKTQQIIDMCEQMINENAIKFETISKGIRKETKLKSQNEFILKENIYLKERIEALEKKVQAESLEGNKTRKMIKTV